MFPSTHWSQVKQAQNEDPRSPSRSVGTFFQRYWLPFRTHLVVHKRIDPDRADDLLQQFLLTRVLENDLLLKAIPQRGRLRNFLLTSLDHFIANDHRDSQAKKRAPKIWSRSTNSGMPTTSRLRPTHSIWPGHNR